MFRCFCFGLSFFFLSFFFLTNKELPFCSVGEPPRAYICMTLPHFPDPSLFESQKVVTLPPPPPPPLGSDKSLNLMPFPWNFRRQTLYRDRSVLNTNSKIYFRKTTGRLLTVKKQCKRISWQCKNIFPTEPIQLVCEVRQNICFLISISAVILKLMVQDHIHFL